MEWLFQVYCSLTMLVIILICKGKSFSENTQYLKMMIYIAILMGGSINKHSYITCSFANLSSSCFVPALSNCTVALVLSPLPSMLSTMPLPNLSCCTVLPTAGHPLLEVLLVRCDIVELCTLPNVLCVVAALTDVRFLPYSGIEPKRLLLSVEVCLDGAEAPRLLI